HQQIFHALFSLPLSKITNRRDADELLAKHIDNAFERAFLLKNLKRVDSGYEWKCDLLEISRNYLKIAGFPAQDGNFDGEVLFIKGSDSDYITDEATPKIQQYFPNANIKTITNAGHLPHVQQPDDFYELVSELLK
ncbi:MAG: alpha/beta hydrolase, partial [Thiotrichaceae bacterium]